MLSNLGDWTAAWLAEKSTHLDNALVQHAKVIQYAFAGLAAIAILLFAAIGDELTRYNLRWPHFKTVQFDDGGGDLSHRLFLANLTCDTYRCVSYTTEQLLQFLEEGQHYRLNLLKIDLSGAQASMVPLPILLQGFDFERFHVNKWVLDTRSTSPGSGDCYYQEAAAIMQAHGYHCVPLLRQKYSFTAMWEDILQDIFLACMLTNSSSQFHVSVGSNVNQTRLQNDSTNAPIMQRRMVEEKEKRKKTSNRKRPKDRKQAISSQSPTHYARARGVNKVNDDQSVRKQSNVGHSNRGHHKEHERLGVCKKFHDGHDGQENYMSKQKEVVGTRDRVYVVTLRGSEKQKADRFQEFKKDWQKACGVTELSKYTIEFLPCEGMHDHRPGYGLTEAIARCMAAERMYIASPAGANVRTVMFMEDDARLLGHHGHDFCCAAYRERLWGAMPTDAYAVLFGAHSIWYDGLHEEPPTTMVVDAQYKISDPGTMKSQATDLSQLLYSPTIRSWGFYGFALRAQNIVVFELAMLNDLYGGHEYLTPDVAIYGHARAAGLRVYATQPLQVMRYREYTDSRHKARPNITGIDHYIAFGTNSQTQDCRLSQPVRNWYLAYLMRKRPRRPWLSQLIKYKGYLESFFGATHDDTQDAIGKMMPNVFATDGVPLMSEAQEAVEIARLIRAEKGTLLERHASVFRGSALYMFNDLESAYNACRRIPKCAGIVFHGVNFSASTENRNNLKSEISLDIVRNHSERASDESSQQNMPRRFRFKQNDGIHLEKQRYNSQHKYFLAQEDIGVYKAPTADGEFVSYFLDHSDCPQHRTNHLPASKCTEPLTLFRNSSSIRNFALASVMN